MAQEGLKQRSPLRKSFIASLRHRRQTGPVYLANSVSFVLGFLHASSFGRPASVVWDGRGVANCANLQSGSLKRADCGITPRTGALHMDIQRAHPHFPCAVGGGYGGLLGREWSSLSRSL